MAVPSDREFAELKQRVERLEVLVRQTQGSGATAKSQINQLMGQLVALGPAVQSLQSDVDTLKGE